jgi:hypothetical protein
MSSKLRRARQALAEQPVDNLIAPIFEERFGYNRKIR